MSAACVGHDSRYISYSNACVCTHQIRLDTYKPNLYWYSVVYCGSHCLAVCLSVFLLSVCLSVCLSVRPSVVRLIRIPFMTSTILTASISFFLSNFSVSLNLFLTRLKTFIRQLPIYSGRTHPLPVETLVDSFGTTGTGSEARKRVTTTMWKREDWMFWWLKRYLKVLRHKMPQILTDL